MQFKSVDDALDFAIAREEEAVQFYRELSHSVENPHTKQVFEGFSREEGAHRDKLVEIKKSGKLQASEKQIRSLNIADYTVDVAVSPGLSYQDALILAMKKEKAAFKLYSDLATGSTDTTIQAVFTMLAQEEARHKLRFEIEYDDFLTEN